MSFGTTYRLKWHSCSIIIWMRFKKVQKVNFEIYVADRKATTCIKLFLLRCVNLAALPLVRCYSICLPRRVASWVIYSSRRTESSSEHFASYLSLLKADAPWCENKRCLDSNPWHFDNERHRQCNLVVSGLVPHSEVSDVDLFLDICENNLTVKPFVVQENCRRLGRPQTGKVQPLLICLTNAETVNGLLKSSKELRKSDDEHIRNKVFFNPDLTPGEAQATFERRQKLRQRPILWR